jgi:hypothetical protein
MNYFITLLVAISNKYLPYPSLPPDPLVLGSPLPRRGGADIRCKMEVSGKIRPFLHRIPAVPPVSLWFSDFLLFTEVDLRLFPVFSC